MSPISVLPILLALAGAICWFIKTTTSPPQRTHKLPPGPRGLPIIGHLHMLGTLPHRSLYKLSKKYGPIMSIRLGNVPIIVVSSPETAELFLKTHDANFASRPKTQTAEFLSYGAKGMGFTPYCSYWRNVRKFCTLELLSTTKIDSFSGMRGEELRLFVEELKDAAKTHQVVDVTEKVGQLIEDITCRMLFGKRRDERFDLSGLIKEMGHLAGAFNISDFLPFLGPLDLQGLNRRFKKAKLDIDRILEIIIDEHEHGVVKNSYRDFVEVLLSLKNNGSTTHDQLANTFDRTNVKAILLDMIFAAIDTSHVSIEWVMSELIRHPRVMKQLQDEVKTVIGENEMVEESHLPKLEYLDKIVKETMRMRPVAPLLIPHESIEDMVIGGYYIPKKSRIIINNWGLGQDPDLWSENVKEFLPERFDENNIDIRGRDFRLIPFGSGRRGCPGIYLGLVTIKLVVAQMVHSFSWELPMGKTSVELDMEENFGLTLARENHLLATPNHRP